jgi:hypothetical protein
MQRIADMSEPKAMTASSRVAIIALTAVLYTVAKGVTGSIPTPWGVGQLLIGIFVPAFLAVVADTFSVAVGAGLGTFLGDVIFLTPAGSTNPALSLIAGVPANFVAFLLFGWFVKRYKSWGAFLAATVSFVTLGNLIAAASVVFFGASVFTPLSPLTSKYSIGLLFGLTLFWSATMIPVIIIAVPLLTRAVRPLQGRSSLLLYVPSWSNTGRRASLLVSLLLALVIVVLVLLYLPGPLGLASFSTLTTYLALGLVGLVIVAPVAGAAASTRVLR